MKLTKTCILISLLLSLVFYTVLINLSPGTPVNKEEVFILFLASILVVKMSQFFFKR